MAGLLCGAGPTWSATEYITPLGGSNKVDWAIINFMDHDPATNTWRDYQGGWHAYDGHDGIDFFLYDFKTMDDGIDVYAAAPGIVDYITDGYTDNRGPYADPVWTYRVNTVYINHDDGAFSSYAHLKFNTIAVTTGQYVARGQKIGQVGSSGSSAEPHLHFQVEYNGQCREIITNDGGQAANFPWFDSYSNQVIRQVVAMGITITNDPAMTSEYGNLFWKQTPCAYSVMHSGTFCVWLKCVGFSTNDSLVVRLVSLSPAGQTIDFSDMAWDVSQYRRAFSGYWYSRWISDELIDGNTYKFQYRWNDEEWQDGPGTNVFVVDDSHYEVYLTRYSPGYSNAPVDAVVVTATDGTSTNSVRLAWATISAAIHYDIYRSETDDVATAIIIARTSNTGYDDQTAVPETIYYYWVRAVNPRGVGAPGVADTGWRAEPNGVGPEVRVNGFNNPPAVGTDETVMVTVQMNPGGYAGVDADWWVAANTPLGWYFFTAGQWLPLVGGLLPAYQGPLFDLPPYPVLDATGLPAGEYTFYFAVDAGDGRLDVSQAWIDSVRVYIR